MRAARDQTYALCAKQFANLDVEPEFLLRFTPYRLARILSAFDPSTWQAPGIVGAKDVVQDEYATLIVDDGADGAHRLTRNQKARNDF
jgi:hypothetical protein